MTTNLREKEVRIVPKDLLTDLEVEMEIERLRASEAVKVAQAEQRMKYRRRQQLYTLRWMEKRGKELIAEGKTVNSFRAEEMDEES